MANEKIRVLFLCNAPRILGGVETALTILWQRMDRERFDVDFVLTGRGPFYEQLVELGAKPFSHPCPGRYSLSWHRFLTAHLRAHRYDVVHLTATLPNVWTLRCHGVPVVSRLNFHRVSRGLYPMRFAPLDRFCSRFFDAHVVVSRSIERHFVARGYDQRKLHLIYNGIELNEARPSTLRAELGLAPGCPVVGTIGRMRPEKGMDLFLQAARLLADKFSHVQFVIAGDGDERANLEALVRTLGLEQKVHFLGFRRDARNVLTGFDVLLYLSRHEAFSNTIIEAMGSRLPVVAAAVGGNVEALQEGAAGILVPPEDPPAAAVAVERLLRDDAARRALTDAAMVAVQEFSVEALVRKHEDLFASLASGPSLSAPRVQTVGMK